MNPEKWAAQPKVSMPIERSVSFLKVPGADEHAVGPLLACLITIMILVGADEALFGAVGKALERTQAFPFERFATLDMIQGFTQAVLGPVWGALCARGSVERKTILAVLTSGQGLATIIMAFFIKSLWGMRLLRCINGACLSGMMPVTFSIIADRFDDELRGRMCALMNMAKSLGAATCGFLYLQTAEWCTSEGRWKPCEYDDPCNETCGCGGLFGWQYAFIICGVVAMASGPLIFMVMKPPPAIVKDSASGENELQMLRKLVCNMPTFLVLVIQGCAGAMPWRSLHLRTFYFQTAGVSVSRTNFIMTTVGYVGIFGAGFSGWLSDTLARLSALHGRIINAEFSVYGSVIIVYVTFTAAFIPDNAWNAYIYFFILSLLLSLVAGGVQGGTNIPILSQLAEPEDRALIISFQASLEGTIASFGPVITVLLNNFFGYDPACNNECPLTRPPECNADQNAEALATALMYTLSVGWGISALLYSSLHYFYPRDMERIFQQRRLKQEAAGLSTELTNA